MRSIVGVFFLCLHDVLVCPIAATEHTVMSSSSSSKGNKELDSMVLSYLDEKGFGEVAKKIGKKLKIKGGNKLPAGALQAAGK